MTKYVIDDARQEIIATWETGIGGQARLVARLPHAVSPDPNLPLGAALADWLGRLSEAAWRRYTGDDVDADDVYSDGPEDEANRGSEINNVVARISDPGDAHHTSYDPQFWYAERIGHFLREVGSADLTSAVTQEVRYELTAVSSAELGDLTGRAAQAVVLTRSGASPTQVDAAWRALDSDLLGSASTLMTQYDPASAAAAAAAWLNAAAHVASETSGTHWTAIIQEADDIEALPVETPTEVLKLIDEGATPHEAVDTLIDEARRVGRALLPNPERIADQVADIYAFTQQHPDSRDAILDQAKLCVLDPARPAPDLLEDLLSGIRGCWLVWREYSWGTIESIPQDADADDDPEDEDALDDEVAAMQETFHGAVRTHMIANDDLTR